jgi:2-polyprenyl-3-methyl-5-hydroxy-6-metoxy-1,4-benzoquinol methylase
VATIKYDFFLDMRERRSHTVILEKIRPLSVVLELGSSTGIMTNYMKNNLNCKVYICEIDESAIQIAKQYAEDAWQGDLESLGWVDAFENIKFDYIICADVLEHLRNPEIVLNESKKLLKDDGSLLLSIPNIGHNSVVFDLLDNKFEYTEVGILDKTHLKFYTYNSLKKLCKDAGYTPVDEDAIYMNYQSPAVLKLLDSVKYRQYSHVFQFVFEIKKTQYVDNNKIDIVNKIEQYPLNDNFQLFIDTGNDYSEENSLKVKINTTNVKELTFDLSNFAEIKNIRIDPSDLNCTIEIKEIVFIDKDSKRFEVDISALNSNAIFHINNIFFFKDIDPQIFINDLSADISSLFIKFEFLDLDINLPSIQSLFLNTAASPSTSQL